MGLATTNEELVTSRDLAREYPRHLERLQEGEVEKLVVTRRGQMQAVVLTVADYEKLLEKG